MELGGQNNNPKVPPHSNEAERSVLGGILIDENAIHRAYEANLDAEDFYRDSHKKIFQTMAELEAKGDAIDFVTLSAALKDKSELEHVGGQTYISQLTQEEFSAANVSYYARIVREKSFLRKMMAACQEAIVEATSGVQDVRKYLDQVQSRIFSVAETKDGGDFTPIKSVLIDNFKRIEKLHQQKTAITGLATGFIDFDRKIAGLQPGALYIIAARPAMGKTSLIMNMVAHAAIREKEPVAVFSLEMGKEELGFRLLTSEARVEAGRLKVGKLHDSDWRKLTRAAGLLNKASIYIDDSSDVNILEMRTKARRLKAKTGLSLLVVDYLQLMGSTARSFSHESRERVISEISRGLKNLAKELNIPIVALSQLNRGLEARTDRRPMLSDLRESGAIEQDADVVCFIYREHVYDKTANPREAELIVAKHRAGPTGAIPLTFLGEYTSFENAASEEEGFQGVEPPAGASAGPSGNPRPQAPQPAQSQSFKKHQGSSEKKDPAPNDPFADYPDEPPL